MQRDMRDSMAQMERDLRQGQRDMRRGLQQQELRQHLRQQHQQHRQQQQQRRQMHQGASWMRQQMAAAQPEIARRSSVTNSGVTTAVLNGEVFVNGQSVFRVPTNGRLSLQTINGVVRVNGEVVWPPSERINAAEQVFRNTIEAVCERDREEPCPICLEPIVKGQRTCTLPCFHFLHQDCAAALFSSDRATSGAAECPVCRAVVATTASP